MDVRSQTSSAPSSAASAMIAGPGVQILVGATGGEVDVRPLDVERYRPGGVREVPEHQGSDVVDLLGDPLQVQRLTRSKIDLGELDQCDVLVEFVVERVAVDRLVRDRPSGSRAHGLDDVEVRMEVRDVG